MLEQILNTKSELTRKHAVHQLMGVALGVSAIGQVKSYGASKSPNQRKLVRITLPGGMSHMDSFDPKPQSPELMGNTKVIKTNTGEEISSYFPLTAKMMDQFTLIRSMSSGEGDHSRARYLSDTSYNQIGTIRHPSLGAWMHYQRGPLNDSLPASIQISGGAGSGFLDSKYDPFKIRDPENAMAGLILQNPSSNESKEFLKLMTNVRKDFHNEVRMKEVDSYAQYYNDALKLMHSRDLVAFDLNLEDKASRKMYDINSGSSLLLARRLLEANVQYINVRMGGWDHHNNLWDEEQFPTKAKHLDKAIVTFLKDLSDRGHLEDTVVCINSEFGRTPKPSSAKGRNHHAKAFFALVAGAGVKKAKVYGRTDDQANQVVENPVSHQSLNATLAHLMGMDLEKETFSSDNRPFTVARSGKVVKDILV